MVPKALQDPSPSPTACALSLQSGLLLDAPEHAQFASAPGSLVSPQVQHLPALQGYLLTP